MISITYRFLDASYRLVFGYCACQFRRTNQSFLTTITAPACSLSITGSVKFSNFRLTKKNLLTTLYIDWHNFLLHYNDHVITLPQKRNSFIIPT